MKKLILPKQKQGYIIKNLLMNSSFKIANFVLLQWSKGIRIGRQIDGPKHQLVGRIGPAGEASLIGVKEPEYKPS